MKIKKYIFSDHYKKSTDRFRDILGLYHDYKDKKVTNQSNPLKSIYEHSVFDISEPLLVNEDEGLYMQNIIYKPARTDENISFMNSEYIENDLEETSLGLIPRRRILNPEIESTGGNGFDNTVQEVNQTDTPPNFENPLSTIDPIKKTNRDIIKEVLASDKRYEDISALTYEVTDIKIGNSNDYIKTEAVYNFSIKEYEKQLESELVVEEVLPNFYVLNLALNPNVLNSITQDDFNSNLALGDSSPYTDLKKKFDNFITLDGNLSLNRTAEMGILFGLVLVSYMQQYAEVYDSVSINYIETIRKRFKHLLNNLTNKELLNKLNDFKNSYPFYINIEWTTPTLSPLLLFLQNAGISLEALQNFLGDKLVLKIQSSSLSNVSKFSILKESSLLNINNPFIEYSQNLYTYDAGKWILDFLSEVFQGTSNETNRPNELLIIDERGNSIPLPDRLAEGNGAQDILDILNALAALPGYNELLNQSIRSYRQIINGDFSKSEILIYKIEKRDMNHNLIQTFYVPNISGLNVQNYVDTQVKYNKNYKYKIFAYTVIYGTEYYYSSYQTIINNSQREDLQITSKIDSVKDILPSVFDKNFKNNIFETSSIKQNAFNSIRDTSNIIDDKNTANYNKEFKR